MYAGLSISLFGSVLFRGLFLGGYDIAKAHLDLEQSSVAVRLCTAHVSPVGTACLVDPPPLLLLLSACLTPFRVSTSSPRLLLTRR